jgi:PD-(D/E)XK nuclease superfamily protein
MERSRGEWTSASNALADRLCPGRHQAQAGLPELVLTEGDAGTVIHALWTGTPAHRQPSADERDKAEALRRQERQVAREFFGTRRGLVRVVEKRLWHEFSRRAEHADKGTLKTSGQPDVILFQAKSRRALIFDSKSGWLPVASNPSNLQLRRLATLLWRCLDPVVVGVCILKPFARPETPCVYTVPDLQRSCQEMQEDVRHSHDPQAQRTAGEEQCRYCRARELCSTRPRNAEVMPNELAWYRRRRWLARRRPERLAQERLYHARVREWLRLPQNRWCRVYLLLQDRREPATHCHHYQGRLGILLLYEPYWIPVSWEGHRWIEDHRERARALNLLCPLGRYNSPVG